MPNKEMKDKRYVFRVSARQRDYMRQICFELGEPLPALLVMGVAMVHREVRTRADYLRLKAELLDSMTEDGGLEPLVS
jgi:hypothetical protein